MWKVFKERPQTAQGKDTKEWRIINAMHARFQRIQQAVNRLKIANTHFLARQSFATAQKKQPEHSQHKRKRLSTVLSKEVRTYPPNHAHLAI